MTHFWHPRTGTTVFLPHLAAATELLVIDLVAQHDPPTDPELASCSHSRISQSLLCQLAPVVEAGKERKARKSRRERLLRLIAEERIRKLKKKPYRILMS
jgi:hypothetical protein